jgi:hypothetical protein
MRLDDEKRGQRPFHMPPRLRSPLANPYTDWDDYFHRRGFPNLHKETQSAKDDVLMQSLSSAFTCPLTLYHTLPTMGFFPSNDTHITIHVLGTFTLYLRRLPFVQYIIPLIFINIGAASQEEVLVKFYWHELSDLLPNFTFNFVFIGPELSREAATKERVCEISPLMKVMYSKTDYKSFLLDPPSYVVDNDALEPDVCVAFNRYPSYLFLHSRR